MNWRDVRCVALLVAVVGSGLPPAAVTQELPDFGALDQGGMPQCLVELAADKQSSGFVVNANTAYFVWAAPKEIGTPHDKAPWGRYGPWTLAPRARHVFIWKGGAAGGTLADAPRAVPTEAELSPELASIHYYNMSTAPVWLMINPLPPGCGGQGADDETSCLAVDFPNGTNGNSIPHWSLGFEFSAQESVTVVALAVWDDMFWNTPGAGFAAKPQRVGLWEGNGTLLASESVSSEDPTTGGGSGGDYWGKWRFRRIDPVTLRPGTKYVVASQGGEPMVYNPKSTRWDPRIKYLSNRAHEVGGGNPTDPLVFPTTSQGGGSPGYFGANMILQTAHHKE